MTKCRKCHRKIERNDNNRWSSAETGTWCVEESTHEPEGLILQSTKITTRRRYELLRADEVDLLVRRALSEIDEHVVMANRMELDGECQIEIVVRQKIKPKEH